MHDPLSSKLKVLSSVAVAFALGLFMASGLGWTESTHAMPTISSEPQVTEAEVRPALDLSDAFVNVSEKVTPAVVRIEVERPRTAGNQNIEVPEQFRRFFDIPDAPEGREMPPARSGGSGFIVSQDGYILTNDHVVGDATQITVWTRDRRSFPAELVGTDPTTDVAVIKIDQEGLPTLSFGNDEELRVGEWILAVGNPGFGGATQLDYTVTAGIVSAKGRPLQLLQSELLRNPEFGRDGAGFAIEDFIQTDAVINPGNSGGPMVNLMGQVVGINSAIASQTGFYQGYGFAIPVNLARRVMEDLIQYGTVRRPWMGVSMQNVLPEDAEYFGLPEVQGALIQSVTDGSPAESAGLETGDVIVAIDGEPVATSGNLQNRVAQFRPGDRITVTVYRDRRPMDVEIRLDEAPINQPRAPVVAAEVSRTAEKLGIEVAELTRELADQYQYEEAGGIVITDVRMSGAAGRRGVVPGWKLLEVNGQPIETEADLQQVLEGAEAGDVVSLLVADAAGGSRIFNIRIPGNP
jgi:serine protease Do